MEFLLGLPRLGNDPLLAAAKRLNAPILLSANSFSRWRTDHLNLREWDGFNYGPLRHAHGLRLHLDSAGFVASARYGAFPWSVDDYLNLAAAHPWDWFASMDWCVEREVAPNDETVLNRISGTVRLNFACRLGAERRGILDRFMPVIQGWLPEQYLRCMDRMEGMLDVPLLGVGSMCRRHVEGRDGILEVVDAIDRYLGSHSAKLHLFGLKSTGAAELAKHPRIQSVDSQAYGTAARRDAIDMREEQPGFAKSQTFVSSVMEGWYRDQLRQLESATTPRALTMPLLLSSTEPACPLDVAWEELRELHESGDLPWNNLSDRWAYEWHYDTE